MSCKTCKKDCKWSNKPVTFNTATPLIGEISKDFDTITVTDECTGTSINIPNLLDIEVIDPPIAATPLTTDLNVVNSINLRVNQPLRLFSADNSVGIDLDPSLNAINFTTLPVTSGNTGFQGVTGTGFRGDTGPQGPQGIRGNTGFMGPFPDGNASNPSITFLNDSNTGFFHSADVLNIAGGGSNRMTVSNTSVTIPTSLTFATNPILRNTLVSNGSGVFTPTALVFNDLGDVNVSPVENEIVVYNGSQWVNSRLTKQMEMVIQGRIYYRLATTTTNTSAVSGGTIVNNLVGVSINPTLGNFFSRGSDSEWTLLANGKLHFSFNLIGTISGSQSGTYRLLKNGTTIQRVLLNDGLHNIDIVTTSTGVAGDVYTLEISASNRTLTLNADSFMYVEYSP